MVFRLRAAFNEMLARSLHNIASCAAPFIAENFQEVHFPSDGIVQKIRAGYLNVQPLFATFSCGKTPGFPQMVLEIHHSFNGVQCVSRLSKQPPADRLFSS